MALSWNTASASLAAHSSLPQSTLTHLKIYQVTDVSAARTHPREGSCAVDWNRRMINYGGSHHDIGE
jgi:hypothetical protein